MAQRLALPSREEREAKEAMERERERAEVGQREAEKKAMEEAKLADMLHKRMQQKEEELLRAGKRLFEAQALEREAKAEEEREREALAAAAAKDSEMVQSAEACESEVGLDAAVSEEAVAEVAEGGAEREGKRPCRSRELMITREHVVQIEEHMGRVEAQVTHLFVASEQVLSSVEVLELETQTLQRKKQEALQALAELQHQHAHVARSQVCVFWLPCVALETWRWCRPEASVAFL
jgi:hypothetical protein